METIEKLKKKRALPFCTGVPELVQVQYLYYQKLENSLVLNSLHYLLTVPLEHTSMLYIIQVFIGIYRLLSNLNWCFFNHFTIMFSLLIMPVVINIFLISISLNIQGTTVITSTMVLGNLYLLIWYYKNYLKSFLNFIRTTIF